MAISRILKKSIDKRFESVGLTCSQAHILGYITHCRDKKICSRDIEKFFSLSHPTVNGILKRLELSGFITVKSDENDKRIKNIFLTEKAIKLNENIEILRDDNNRMVAENINEDERALFVDILNRIYTHIKEEVK